MKKIFVFIMFITICITLISCDKKSDSNDNPQFMGTNPLFTDNLLAVEENNKWGVINSDGNYVIKPEYDNLKPLEDGLFYVSTIYDKNNFFYNSKVINKSGKTINNKYDSLVKFPQLEYYNDSGKYGFKENGDIVITPQYDSVLYALNKDFIYVVKNNEVYLIDDKNNSVLDNGYGLETKPLNFDHAAIYQDGKYAIANSTGTILTDFIYDSIVPYGTESLIDIDYASIEKDGLYGLYDLINDRVLFEPESKTEIKFSQYGVAVIVNENNDLELIDINNNPIISGITTLSDDSISNYENKFSFNIIEGLFEINNDSTYYIYNLNGDLLYSSSQYAVYDFNKNYIVVKNNENKFGIIDYDNNILYGFTSEQPTLLSDSGIYSSTTSSFDLNWIDKSINEEKINGMNFTFNHKFLQGRAFIIYLDGDNKYLKCIDDKGNVILDSLPYKAYMNSINMTCDSFFDDGYALISKQEGVFILKTDGTYLGEKGFQDVYPLNPIYDKYYYNGSDTYS